MIQRWGPYINEFGYLSYGWIEPIQLWLPFEHLDFLWTNLRRSEVAFWRSTK